MEPPCGSSRALPILWLIINDYKSTVWSINWSKRSFHLPITTRQSDCCRTIQQPPTPLTPSLPPSSMKYYYIIITLKSWSLIVVFCSLMIRLTSVSSCLFLLLGFYRIFIGFLSVSAIILRRSSWSTGHEQTPQYSIFIDLVLDF